MVKNDADFIFKMWKLLHKIQKNNFKQYSDAIVALAHCVLIFNCELDFLGLGDDKKLRAKEEIFENLPDGWNAQVPRYTLRYCCKDKLYILFGFIANDLVILNLLNVDTKEVSNVAFPLDKCVALLQMSSQINDEINAHVQKMTATFKEHLTNPSIQTANEMTIEDLIKLLKSDEKKFFKGYQLFLTTMQKCVKHRADDVVLCIHFILHFHMGIDYLGNTDNYTDGDEPMLLNDMDIALPENWNNGGNNYVLSYRRYRQRFLLCVNVFGSILALNFINCLDLSSRSLALNFEVFGNEKKNLALEILEKLLKPIISLQIGPPQFVRDIFKQNSYLRVNPDENDDAYL